MTGGTPAPGSLFAPAAIRSLQNTMSPSESDDHPLRLSAQHYQANRLDLLSRLAGDISHEIKNPLHAMVINLELVRRKIEKGESPQALERVAIVEDEIRKVHSLANALLEALRPPRDAQDTSSFSTVLQELMPLVTARARLARVDLELKAESLALIVPLSAQDLRLLLLNIADRTVRVAQSGDAISMRAWATADDGMFEVECAEPPLDATERAWLADSPAAAEEIELGLRVMRALAERAGGRVQIGDSAEGRPTLTLRLPRAGSA